MGGGRFDGLPAREGEKGEDYVPGTPGYDHELLELLVDRYLGKSFWGKKLKGYARAEVWQHRDSIERPDELLSGMAYLLSTKGMGTHHTRESYRLFYSVVEALYDAGWNDLTLDLTPLAGMMPEHVCRWHEGTPERPLSLSCIVPPTPEANELDVVWAGEHVQYCKIRVSGTVECAGYWSSDSEFIFERHIETLGWYSDRCAYSLSGAKDIELSRAGWNSVSNCFRLDVAWQKERAPTLLDPYFFERGNTLLVPDGSGGWKGVRP